MCRVATVPSASWLRSMWLDFLLKKAYSIIFHNLAHTSDSSKCSGGSAGAADITGQKKLLLSFSNKRSLLCTQNFFHILEDHLLCPDVILIYDLLIDPPMWEEFTRKPQDWMLIPRCSLALRARSRLIKVLSVSEVWTGIWLQYSTFKVEFFSSCQIAIKAWFKCIEFKQWNPGSGQMIYLHHRRDRLLLRRTHYRSTLWMINLSVL